MANPQLPGLSSQPIPAPPRTQALASETFCVPVLDGSSTLVDLCDWHRERSPNHPFFIFPSEDEALKTITWSEATYAINRGTKLMQDCLPNSEEARKPAIVAIISLSETVAYSITILALMRANFIPFLISPRNSPAIVAHLLSSGGVKHVLSSSDDLCSGLVDAAVDILKADNKTSAIPNVSPMFLTDDFFPPSPVGQSEVTYDGSKSCRDPESIAVYIHSSGSTSQYPKIIPWTNRKLIEIGTVPYYGGRDMTGSVISLHGLPMFHSLAVSILCMMATTGLVSACFEPQFPPKVPNPDNVLAASNAASCDIILGVPSYLEEWSREPEKLAWLSERNSSLAFGGSPLSKETGDRLVSLGISVITQYGATEVGTLASFFPSSPPGQDWEYFTFSGYCDVKPVPQGDGTFEVVVIPSASCIPSLINTSLDGVDCYTTSDLVVAHPQKPGLWKLHGRSDDQIIHSSGEKTNPGPLEAILRQDPCIRAAVLFGKEQFHIGALVEAEDSHCRDVHEFCEKIWPSVKRANTFAPQHSRILKEMILIADPAKPFKYTAKGTARRQVIIDDYKEEISKLYETIANESHPQALAPSEWNAESTEAFVREVVQNVLPNITGNDDDFFRHGCDSLHAISIRNTILRAIRDNPSIDTRQASPNFVYEHPTIMKLARYLLSAMDKGLSDSTSNLMDSKIQNMRHLAERYSRHFPKLPGNKRSARLDFCNPTAFVHLVSTLGRFFISGVQGPSQDSLSAEKANNIDNKGVDKVVLLTGTTGGFGCFLLAALLEDPEVSHVYALNRVKGKESDSLGDRQQEAFLRRGLNETSLESEKLTLLEGNLMQGDFGLPSTILRGSTMAAWPVDFNLGLSFFEPILRALRNLLDFSIRTGSNFLFVSSVGVLTDAPGGHSMNEREVPPQFALCNGYTESKWVAEQVILNAVRQTKTNAKIVRVGQLCGSKESGAWNIREWAPALIQSGSWLGCIPTDDRVVAWISPNDASKVIVDLLNVETTAGSESIFHLRHPNPTPWSSLASTIATELGAELVSYEEWLKKLKTQDGAQRIKYASRLLSHYEDVQRTSPIGEREAFGTPLMDIQKTARVSRSLHYLATDEMGENDVKRWLRYWKEMGYYC